MNTLYIVDGQKAVCQMLAESLSSRDYIVAGTSEKITEAIEEIVEAKPHLVVLEMILPDGQGASLIERVRAALPDTRFLIFSDDKEGENIKACLQAGAHGFVEKSVEFGMFLKAVKMVDEGGCFFGFNITEVLRTVVSAKKKVAAQKDSLTDREREVLCLIAEGNSNKEIASKLSLSVKTVDNHRCSMMRKLDVHNVAAITRYAVEHRLVAVKFAD
ncbi:LuxR C-terminal-related transcriptional regulator [Pelagicoccus mobilis]|uniref:Response regulator transcription factor n=1 Tax=Pelagicoccus mobilis TaxID=415221 RepID=A0A934VLT0_9BACT|nr:response regulator transcription factor [Pelagicoccus mobilis]MBK1878091.1 response regulator transcription factor [Pelagicoccus mobilis]